MIWRRTVVGEAGSVVHVRRGICLPGKVGIKAYVQRVPLVVIKNEDVIMGQLAAV